jgi:hypothetical protein
LAWKSIGAVTYAGYILGFPNDTPESIRRDIRIVQKELPLDIIEFFILTPLPGSEDHQILYRKGVAMDPDMNNYDTEHAATAHPRMSKEELQAVYAMRGHLSTRPSTWRRLCGARARPACAWDRCLERFCTFLCSPNGKRYTRYREVWCA